MYTRYLEKHVRPFIGRLKAGAVDAEALDSLYAELRRCRTHCTDARDRPPDPARARVRRAVPPARAGRCRRRRSATSTSSSAAPTRRACAGGGCRRTRSSSRPPPAAAAGPAAAVGRGGRADRRGGVGGPGLGCARLADDDDGCAARRAVRAALVARRPADRCADLPARHRPGRPAPRGEGHQDPPAAAGVARPRDGRGAHRALGAVLERARSARHRPRPDAFVFSLVPDGRAPRSVVGDTAVRPARATARASTPTCTTSGTTAPPS